MLQDLVTLVGACGVMTLRERGIEDDVIAGRQDIRLNDLAWDSLSIMEFCIALEDRWGFYVTPDDIDELGTLGGLARILDGRSGQ